jgi:UDP-glucuronate decarboxylase
MMLRNVSGHRRGGFLGSHLCERLLAEGHDVLCIDNFFTGTKDNVLHLLDNHHFELVRTT